MSVKTVKSTSYELWNDDSSKRIPKLEDEKYALGFYSPPYNTGIEDLYDEYTDNLSYDDYVNWQVKTFLQLEAKIKAGGHIIINMPLSMNRSPPQPYLITIMETLRTWKNTEMVFMGSKPWIKGHAAKHGIAVGSIANKPSFTDSWEMVVVFRKGKEDRDGKPGGKVTGEFLADMANPWYIQPDTRRIDNHQASMPIVLAKRAIKWFTRKEEWVIDPFMGTGTTPLAAISMNRKGAGIELSENYYNIAKRKMLFGKRDKALF